MHLHRTRKIGVFWLIIDAQPLILTVHGFSWVSGKCITIFSQLNNKKKKSQPTAFSIQEMHVGVELWSAVVCPACVIPVSNICVHTETWICFSFLLPWSNTLPNIWAHGRTSLFHLITVDNGQGQPKLTLKQWNSWKQVLQLITCPVGWKYNCLFLGKGRI